MKRLLNKRIEGLSKRSHCARLVTNTNNLVNLFEY